MADAGLPTTGGVKRFLRHEVVRQGGAYGLVGLVQLLVDWLCYVVLTSVGTAVIPANIAARVSGATLGFLLNGAFTFRGSEGARLGWRRLLKFTLAWTLMTALGTLAVALVDARYGLQASWLAKPVVDVLLAGLGFLVSRYWIYR